MGALLRPPELLRPRLNRQLGRCVEPLAGERRPPARPQVVQEVDEAALTRSTQRCWSLLFLSRRQEQHRSFPQWRAGRRILCFFLFLFPLSQRKSNFLFLKSMGRQCVTPCFLTLTHDPFCQQPREYVSGTMYLPTHLWPVPFGTQGVQ